MTRKERYRIVLDYFRSQMPVVTTELEFGNAFQLLCATLLSAQCTDKRVNQVTPALFAAYPTAKEMAAAEPEDVLEYVRSVSYPNAKSRHLVEMARMIVADFGGEVPDAVSDLVKLPGVGRKTANVMQAVWFGRAAMAVDTHVYRVSHRMGLVGKADNTPESRAEAYVQYPCRRRAPCPPLAAVARTVCVQERQAEMWGMYIQRYLSEDIGRQQTIIVKILDDSKLS